MTYQPNHKLASFNVDQFDGFTVLKYWDGNMWGTKRSLCMDLDQVCKIAEWLNILHFDKLIFDDDHGWTLIEYIYDPHEDIDVKSETSAIDALNDLDEQDWVRILHQAIKEEMHLV